MEAALSICGAVHAAALVVWFGVLSLPRVLGREALEPWNAQVADAQLRALRIAAICAWASAMIWPLLVTAVALDDPGAALDPQRVTQLLTQTRFGTIWLVRLAVVSLAVATLAAKPLASARGAYLLVSFALASLGLLGHTAAVPGAMSVIQSLIVALHLLAAGAWLGSLPVLRHLALRRNGPDLARTLRGFTRFGASLVVLILASGAVTAFFRGLTPANFLDGAYGRILACKIVLVALMGVAALLNRNRFTPALDGADLQVRERARRFLRRSIAIEFSLGLTVVLLAAFLGQSEPPA